ncbi:MAG: ParA family protein [Microthrixaceae bacterium]
MVLGLAAAAQRAGDPALIIDLDPQGSASWSTGVEATDEYLSVGDVIRTGDPKVAEAATVTSGWGEGVDVLPSELQPDRPRGRLQGSRVRQSSAPRRRTDCSAATGMCSSTAPHRSVRPPAPDWPLPTGSCWSWNCPLCPFEGPRLCLRVVDEIWEDVNPNLDIGGVIVNRAPAVSIEAHRQEEALNRLMGSDAVWHPFIPQRTILNEAVGERCPVHALGYRGKDIADIFDQLYERLVATVEP